MSNATVLRGGQIGLAGDATAIFLKTYAGEVLTAFEEKNVTMDKVWRRSIASGKSAAFPLTWKLTASEHTVGTELVGQTSELNEVIIAITDMLVADAFIAEIDEAMAHYEVRSIYSTEAGRALANAQDQRNFRAIGLAAREAAPVTGGNGGTDIGSITATDSQSLADAVYSARQTLAENDVPLDGVHAAFKPAQYFLLPRDTTNVVHRDFGGEGSYAKGDVKMIAGIPVIWSNNVPTTNVTTGPAALQGNFSTTVGLVWHPMAAGVVSLLDISVRADYDPRRLGTLVVAKMATGADHLRPDCAVELSTDV